MLVLTEPMAQKLRRPVSGAERLGQRRDLDRVAERRAGAVRLDVADACRARRPAVGLRLAMTSAWPSTLGAV